MPRPGWEESRSPLLHPVAVVALALLVVNDHLLKAAWPGLVTGKASDVAALILVPPLAVEVARLLAGGRLARRARALVAAGAAIAIAAIFVAVKLHPAANEAYAISLGLAQWPGVLFGSLLTGTQIPPPGRAPTVLDAGDLITLPSAAIGWWVASGSRWRPAVHAHAGTRLAAAGRVGLLLGALFSLAATSQSPPTQATDVAQDEVLLGSDQPSAERHATVAIDGVSATGSIAIEARSRWPLVAPAPRFLVSREGTAPSGPAVSNRVSVDPATCRSGCNVPVVVVIDWPGSPDARTSVAWEVVATVRAGPGEYLPYSGVVHVEGDGFAARWHGLAPWVSVPFAVVLAVLVLAGTGTLAPVERRGVKTPGEAVVLITSSALAGILLIGALVTSPSVLEPAAGYAAGLLRAVCLAAGLAVAIAALLWWRGRGASLAIAIVAISLIGLPFATRLIDEASATFAGRGLAIVGAISVLAAISLAGALRRPGRIGDVAWIAPSRVLVAAVGIATATCLLVAAGLDRTASGIAGSLAFAHVVAVALWWGGGGKLLGLTSFAIGAGTVLRGLMGGPQLFGSPWTSWDLTMILGVCVGAAVTIVAAFGGIGRHPIRPGGSEEATRIAVEKAIAESSAEPPAS